MGHGRQRRHRPARRGEQEHDQDACQASGGHREPILTTNARGKGFMWRAGGRDRGYSAVVLGSRGRITAKAMRPIATQTASRSRLTRLKVIAVVDESPRVANVATKPPSRTPRLAGTRKVATLIAVPKASITVAVASETSLPRNLRISHVSREPRSQAMK